jgi:hypothetical protein
MRGDFSRTTHRPNRHYSRVLLQQGRVLLDADWNEQVEIQLQAMRQMMRDLIGPHGGPSDALAFRVELAEADNEFVFTLGTGSEAVQVNEHKRAHTKRPPIGRYYVDGIMIEHDAKMTEGKPVKLGTAVGKNAFVFVYLEVWEQHVTWIEENKRFKLRSMREVALDGPDTCSRAQVRWAIEAEALPKQIVEYLQKLNEANGDDDSGERQRQVGHMWSQLRLQQLSQRGIKLWAGLTTQDIGAGDPCRDTAQPRYRGPENRLYRVEIHSVTDGVPAFKWSRENGSVVFPIAVDEDITFDEGKLTLALGIGSDPRFGLERGDIVELVTEVLDADGEAGPLFEVDNIDVSGRAVTLSAIGTSSMSLPPKNWALLRRWDQSLDSKRSKGSPAQMREGAIVIDGTDEFVLEDGIVVRFLIDKPADKPVEPPAERAEPAPEVAPGAEGLRFEELAAAGLSDLLIANNLVGVVARPAFASVQPFRADVVAVQPRVAMAVAAPPPAAARAAAPLPAPRPPALPPPASEPAPIEQASCRVGDYWLIPARTIPGDVEWRKLDELNEAFELPHGVARHYAPLAMIQIQDGQSSVIDLRRRFNGLAG